MPKRIEPLTPSATANAKPKAAPYKLRDGRGLHLLVEPNGSKGWRFEYRRPGTGKRNTLSLGVYPEVSLKRAREKREEARTLLADGIDPGAQRKAEESAKAETFEAVAREWFSRHSSSVVDTHADRILRRFERDIFPYIGNRPIASITPPEILTALRRIENRNAIETAHRALQSCAQVFRYGVATGRIVSDPTRDLRGALAVPTKRRHASIREPAAIGELLRAFEGFKGTPIVAGALKLAPLVFLRPGELRKAEWAEIDLDRATWTIPPSRMKRRKADKLDPLSAPHIVPLSEQAVAALRELHPLTGRGRYVFPGRDPKKPMSEVAILAALRRLGFDKDTMTGHGFRHMASTRLRELGWPRDVVEAQMVHRVQGVEGVYNMAEYLPERRKMMQAWADYLDTLRSASDKVVPIRRATG